MLVKTPFRKTDSLDPTELKPLPRLGVINAIQFQLFDDGQKPGRGRSHHQIKMEVYCDGRKRPDDRSPADPPTPRPFKKTTRSSKPACLAVRSS